MSSFLALQQALFNALIGDVTLRSILATNPDGGSPTIPAVYDHVPQADASEADTAFPYVAIGEFTAGDFDTDDVNGVEHTVTLHVWDRRRGRKRAKQIADALYNLLHNQALEVSGHHAVFCYFEFGEDVPDPESLMQHLVQRYRIVIQQH